jgi:hypothetical protein
MLELPTPSFCSVQPPPTVLLSALVKSSVMLPGGVLALGELLGELDGELLGLLEGELEGDVDGDECSEGLEEGDELGELDGDDCTVTSTKLIICDALT